MIIESPRRAARFLSRLVAFCLAAMTMLGGVCDPHTNSSTSEENMIESLVRKFLYYPEPLPPDAPLPHYAREAREVWIDTPDGGRIHTLYWPAPEGRPTILFFHGNAQTVFEWALIRQELTPLDCGLLLVDYPGYGKSHGVPSEATNYDAGHGAYAWLTGDGGVPAERVIFFGKSLGGGIATEVAQGKPALGMVLESTFTSIPAVVKRLIPMLPSGGMMKSEIYDSADKLATIHIPLLVVHGTSDETIPFDEGEKLFLVANKPKQFFRVDGAGHNDVAITAGPEYGRRLRAWLDEIEASR